MAHTSLLLFSLLSVAVSVALDPCAHPMYLYDNGDRSPGCSPTPQPLADCTLREGWYKIVNLTGPLHMTPHALKGPGCGTKHPIWIKDPHPKVTEGVVIKRACVWTGRSSCDWTIDIKVKNCSSYFVYYLKKTRYNHRYCFGSEMTCKAPGNDTSLDDQKYHPVYLSFSTKFGCMMFLGGLMVGALLVISVVLVRARRDKLAAASRPARREPVVVNNLPPPYNECVGPVPTTKY